MRFLIVLVLATAALAGDWPQFRGAMANGVGDGANPPVKWDVSKNVNVVWKTEIPGLSVSSPVIFGDKIYLTTSISSDTKQGFRTGLYGDTDPVADKTNHQWKVMAYDKKSGKLLWEKLSTEGVPKTKRHPKSSQSSPTPATNGKVVIAYFGSEGLYSYDTDGKLLWKKDLGLQNAGWFFDPDSEWGAASSPIIFENTVIVQCDRQKDSFIAAYDLTTGREVWRTARPEIPAWGTPTIVQNGDQYEVVTNSTKAIRGYDARTGKELWTIGPNSEITCSTPVSAHGLIFVSGGYTPVQPIYAIKIGSKGDLTLKEGQESSESVAWSKKTGGVYMPTPLVYGDHLYMFNSNGILSVYEAKTGTRLYQQRIGGGAAFAASPIAAAGKIYLVSEEGEAIVIKAGAKYEVLSTNPIGEQVMATPAFSGDLLVVRGAKYLMGIQ